MGRITNMLDAINVQKENTDELYKIFRMVPDFDVPLIRYYLYKGTSLVRQRVNEKDKNYYRVSDLIYPPASCVTGYERANIPYQPMFYACSFPGDYESDRVPPPRVVTLMETSAFYRDRSTSGIERSTVSRWDIVEDLELAAMPFIADYSMACQLIKEIKDGWDNEIGKYHVNPDGLELIMYMANEIGKTFASNVEYFKIANFVNYLLNVNEKTRNVDGIIYPSVPGAGSGFNVALKPLAVNKKLQFGNASLCHLLKKKEKAYLRVINRSVSVENGMIIYRGMDKDPQEESICAQYSGLNFIN